MNTNVVNYEVRSEPGVVLKMADGRAYFGHSNINRKVGTRLSSVHAVRSWVAFRRVCSGRQLRVQPANAMVVYTPPANAMRCVHKSQLATFQIVDPSIRQPVDLLSFIPFTLMAGAISPAGLAKEFCALAAVGYILMRILKRVWAILYQWWQRTAGFRLSAICHRIIGAWCSWLHPRRCRDYAIIAVLLTTVYPQWPMPIGPFVVYLLNATVGAVVVQAAPLRLR
jgi:hypothetical protein